jgi:hypothetical protein
LERLKSKSPRKIYLNSLSRNLVRVQRAALMTTPKVSRL